MNLNTIQTHAPTHESSYITEQEEQALGTRIANRDGLSYDHEAASVVVSECERVKEQKSREARAREQAREREREKVRGRHQRSNTVS